MQASTLQTLPTCCGTARVSDKKECSDGAFYGYIYLQEAHYHLKSAVGLVLLVQMSFQCRDVGQLPRIF